MKQPPLTGIPAAIRALDRLGTAGTLAELARRVSVSRQTLYEWRDDGIPLKRLPGMMRATGLTPAILRPDYRTEFRKQMGVSPEQFFKDYQDRSRRKRR